MHLVDIPVLITPILKGSCQMQGPMDDSDNNLLVDMVEHQPKKRCEKNLLNDSVHKRAVSGTCNVCSAPCSSCMHNERMDSAMESNVEAAFPVNTSKKGSDNFSSVNFEGRPRYKSRPCNDVEHAASEGSNFSVHSSNDSSSGNAESKIATSIPDICDTSEGLDMSIKVLPGEIVAEDRLLKRSTDCKSNNAQDLLSSLSHIVSESHLRPLTPCDEEKHELGCDGNKKKHGLECPGDSTSCNSKIKRASSAANYFDSVSDTTTKQCFSSVTNGLPSKCPIKTLEVDKTGVVTNSRRSVESTKESLRRYSGSSSNCSHMEDSQPKNQPPCMLGQIKLSSSSFQETEESPSFQPLGEPFEASLEQEISPLVTSIRQTTDGSKLANSDCVDMLPDNGDIKPSSVKNEISADQSKNAHLNGKLFSDENKQNQRDGTQSNIGKSCHELVKSDELKEEKGNSAIDSESLEPSPESNRVSDNHSEPDIFEDDVKVCDICGDAGREDMLAICSRCSDGAEHTYCMRIMLDKVPDGDWLCEDCKFKEDEDKKVFMPETTCGMTKEISFNKSHQDIGSSSLGILSKLNDKPSPATSVNLNDLNILDRKPSTATNAIKDVRTASERLFDNNEVTSTSRKVLDMKKPCIQPRGITKSTVKKDLSRENSFKSLDSGKVRAVEVNSAHNALDIASTNFDSSSPKVQVQFHSPRGSFSGSSSDNLKLKPKPVTENVLHKMKLLNEPPKIDGKKDVMAKSASFKGARPSHLNIDAIVKGQFTNRSLDARNPIHSMDKGILERKNLHMPDRLRVSSTLSNITSSKKEQRVSSHDGKLSNISERNVVVATKGSEEVCGSVTVEEMKQQTSLSEKSFPLNRLLTFEDQKKCRREHNVITRDKVSKPVVKPGLLQSWQYPGRDLKSKSVTLGAPRQAASAIKILKCQRCNETGHATQSCSIDKIHSTALKPSGEKNLVGKPNKWKDTVEAVISKTRFHNRIADQPDRPTFASANCRKNITDDDKLLDVSLAVRNSAPLEGTSGMQESTGSFKSNVSKLTIQNSNKRIDVLPTENVSTSSSDMVISSDALNHVSAMQMLTEKVSKNFSPSRISAIPKIPHIWQGSFEIHKNGEPCNLYDGVQAHLSTSASPKVLEVASNFPCKLHLKEASCGDSWPSQFLRKSPTEEDIALFFFAADFDSYQKKYTKLVDNMLKKDLVLKGSLDGFELLIFPSTKLPQRSQCWNRFYFLWGVFRGKRTNCSEQPPASGNICNPGTSPQGTVQDLTSAVVLAFGSFTQNERSSGTERRSFDLNENPHDDKLIDEAVSINHLPSKKQRTCFFSEDEPTITNMPTNGCSNQIECIGVHENSLSFPEKSKAKSEDALFGSTVLQTISPGPVLEKEKSKNYEIVIDLEAIPWDPSEEKQDEFTSNVQTGNKATSLGEDGAALPDTFIRNRMEKLIDRLKVPQIGPASYQGQGHEKGKAKTVIDLEVAPQDLPQEDDVSRGALCWDARPNLKRIATYTPEQVSQASVETLWKEKDNLLLDQGKEPANKKLKLSNDARGDCDHERVDYGSPEKFFPVTSGSLTEHKSGNSVPSQVLPFDEDVTHPNIPNLELALGAEKERQSQKILPLFRPLADSDHATPSDCFKNEDDSNLSLSLSFPSPKTESSLRGTKQKLNSSLLLFQGVIDSGNR